MAKPFKYYRPETYGEALELLADPSAEAMPLIVSPKPLDPRLMGAGAFVDLSLLDLNYICESADGEVRIGSLTTLQDVIDSPILNRGAFYLLAQGADLAATPAIRNLASLWGAVQARSGSPEFVLALLALDAELILISVGEKRRRISLKEFIGLGKHAMQPGEMLVEACVFPFNGHCGWVFERVARTPRDEPIVTAAALLEIVAGRANQVRIALAGAYPFPQRLSQVEEMLTGASYNENIFQTAAEAVMSKAQPVADFRGSADYRRAMAGLVVQRALRRAWQSVLNRQSKS